MRGKGPWSWVSTLYLAEGLPYVLVNAVSVILYKRLGLSNATVAWATSWLYLPWVVKPLWSPWVEVLRTKRAWILTAELCLGGGLASLAWAIPTPGVFRLSLAAFWLIAFASATQDIAIDGFYMLALTEKEQAAWVGVRSTFYRIAMIAGQGGVVVLAGVLEARVGVRSAWTAAFFVCAALFAAFWLYHRFALPRVEAAARVGEPVLKRVVDVFGQFFRKPGIVGIIAFLLLYRLAEAQLVKLISPFLLDARDKGGLGLSTAQVGVAYGTVGVIALAAGGILGGIVISRHGLKAWLWPMVFALHLPDLAYVLMSQVQPSSFWAINALVALEQFGYGFAYTAYALYMIYVSDGPYKTAHFALCTGFMALGMMVPGLFAGFLQEHLGYRGFFLWVMASTLPGFWVAARVRIPKAFGRRGATSETG